LDQSPSKVELWFEDPVIIHSGSITVTNEQGEQFQTSQSFLDVNDHRHVIALLQNNMPDGTYNVQFNVLSLDGYEVRDQYRFRVHGQSSGKQDLILEKSTPNDGEIAQTSPYQIELWFSQPAEITAIGIFDDTGKSMRAKEPNIDPSNPRHIIVRLESELPPGTYQVSWYAAPKENAASNAMSERQGVYYFAVGEVLSIAPAQWGLLGRWVARGKWPILFYGLALLLWPSVSGHSSYPRYGVYVSINGHCGAFL
jgi:copper transport protein